MAAPAAPHEVGVAEPAPLHEMGVARTGPQEIAVDAPEKLAEMDRLCHVRRGILAAGRVAKDDAKDAWPPRHEIGEAEV